MKRVEQIEIGGYKQLAGTYVFGPGLTVVTGPNESGKSTLHSALVSGLFGFSSSDRRQRAGGSGKDLCRPWDGKPFRLSLTLSVRDGRTVRIDWDFTEDAVIVRDALTGEELLREQPTQRLDYRVGPDFLGISREEHEQLSCLFQQGVELVDPTENLRQSLQRAVEATTVNERGAQEADERLRALLAEIGVQSHHYGLLANGRLRQLQRAITDLESELEAAEKNRSELDELASEQMRRAQVVTDLAQRRLEVEQTRLRHEAKRLEAVAGEAATLSAMAPSGQAVTVDLPADLPGRIASAHEDLEDARAERMTALAKADGLDLAPIQAELRQAEAELERHAPYASVSTEPEEDVRAELAVVSGGLGLGAPPDSPPARDPALQRFRDGYRFAAPASRDTPRQSPLLIAGAGLVLIGFVAGVVVSPAAFALVLLGGGLVYLGLREGSSSMTSNEPLFEGQPVAALRARTEAEDHAWIQYEAIRDDHARVAKANAQALEHSSQRLRELLDHASPGNGELQDRAKDFLTQCGRHRSWIEASARVERVHAQLRAAAEPAAELKTASERVERMDAELRRLLSQAEVRDEDLDVGLERFAALVQAAANAREGVAHQATAAGRLEQLMGGQTLDELRLQAQAGRAALEVHEQAHGVLSPVERSDATTANELAQEQTDASARAADLAARRDERELAIGDPADIKLRLDRLIAQQDNLLLVRDAVQLARNELQESAREAHRRVAPHLNLALKAALPRITRGRYADAMVDEDLTIKVVVPGTGTIATVEQLSRGTRDQIAVVQRLELARLLYPDGDGAPLLLDDCFAHTDAFRLPLVMELLAEVAENRQVVVFSDSEDVVEAVRAAAANAAVIELPDPVEEGVSSASGIAV